MGTLISLLLPAVPDLIRMAEAAIKGDKAGTDRKDIVMQGLRAIATKAIARKEVPDASITDDALAALIEADFTRMKSSGQLAVAGVPETAQIYILKGRITPLGLGNF